MEKTRVFFSLAKGMFRFSPTINHLLIPKFYLLIYFGKRSKLILLLYFGMEGVCVSQQGGKRRKTLQLYLYQ